MLKIVKATGVDPDVEGKNGAQAGENFVRLPAFTLLIYDVALQEDAAAHRQLRHRFREKRAVGHAAHGNVEALRDALQERAVAGGALGVEAEVGDGAVVEDHDLHVDAADIADAIGIREEMQAGGGVGDRFDNGAIGAKNSLQQIFSVTGDCQAENFSAADGFANLAEERLGVFDRIPFAERVAGKEQIFFGRHANGFGSGRSEITTYENGTERTRVWSFG